MTDYSDVPIIYTGDWIDAAWLNQYVGDNLRAFKQGYVNAGDMAYALDGNTINAVSMVPNGLFINDAGTPEWLAPSAQYHTLRMGEAKPEWTGFISAKAVRSTNQSIDSGVESEEGVVFTSVEYSQLVTWSVGDPTKLIIIIPGLYALFGKYIFDGGTGYRQCRVIKNNTVELISSRESNAAGETTYLPGLADLFLLDTDDYLEMKVQHNQGNAINLRGASLGVVFLGAA